MSSSIFKHFFQIPKDVAQKVLCWKENFILVNPIILPIKKTYIEQQKISQLLK